MSGAGYTPVTLAAFSAAFMRAPAAFLNAAGSTGAGAGAGATPRPKISPLRAAIGRSHEVTCVAALTARAGSRRFRPLGAPRDYIYTRHTEPIHGGECYGRVAAAGGRGQ